MINEDQDRVAQQSPLPSTSRAERRRAQGSSFIGSAVEY